METALIGFVLVQVGLDWGCVVLVWVGLGWLGWKSCHGATMALSLLCVPAHVDVNPLLPDVSQHSPDEQTTHPQSPPHPSLPSHHEEKENDDYVCPTPPPP